MNESLSLLHDAEVAGVPGRYNEVRVVKDRHGACPRVISLVEWLELVKAHPPGAVVYSEDGGARWKAARK